MDHWLYDTGEHPVAGWLLFLLLAGGGTAALVVFIRRTRDDRVRSQPALLAAKCRGRVWEPSQGSHLDGP
jgi:hypothetical protein